MVVTTADALRLLPKIERGLGTERARLGTFRGLGTERARLGTFRGFGTERARLGTFRGFLNLFYAIIAFLLFPLDTNSVFFFPREKKFPPVKIFGFSPVKNRKSP